jgi:hypothetical protein|tara:strand:- start:6348 stop:6938 length:591 start_codon:yes stop_codon:yes gene_type:complete
MMKKFLAILILIFTLQTPSQADDIIDFQIEGMSIGDSLLDYFSKEEIKQAENNPALIGDEKFIIIFSPSQLEIYNQVQITYKLKDKKYLIHSLEGKLDFKNNIEDCNKKMKEILYDVKDMFKDSEITEKVDRIHKGDESGKSTTTGTFFLFKSKDYVDIYCTDWSAEMHEKEGWTDDLTVTLGSSEFRNFLLEFYN